MCQKAMLPTMDERRAIKALEDYEELRETGFLFRADIHICRTALSASLFLACCIVSQDTSASTEKKRAVVWSFGMVSRVLLVAERLEGGGLWASGMGGIVSQEVRLLLERSRSTAS